MSPIQICWVNCLKNSCELARKRRWKSAQEGARTHTQAAQEGEQRNEVPGFENFPAKAERQPPPPPLGYSHKGWLTPRIFYGF
jgi:hypothetical protein